MSQYTGEYMCMDDKQAPPLRFDFPLLHGFDYNTVLHLDLSTQANAYTLVRTA